VKRTEIANLYKNPAAGDYTVVKSPDAGIYTVCGWVRTIRKSKGLCFIALNDGSTGNNLQIVAEESKLPAFEELSAVGTGAGLSVSGMLILTPEAKQPFELNISSFTVLGSCPPDYPLQKKNHSPEFLRTIPHLRVRSNTFGNVFRVRSEAAFAIHEFFHRNGFSYVHTPIITDSDCEGAGEMFSVTTLPADSENYSEDFFGKHAALTVSGQLEGEYLALALGKIYTFGPTFRAEQSYTPRHAAEFWMIEPEIAFADLSDDMDIAEAMLKYVLKAILERCPTEMAFFDNFYEKGIITRLEAVINADFARCSYTEAIDRLENASKTFEYPVSWGMDLQTEHERYLSEEVFGKPVFVYDYPVEIKAFYMRQNDDNKTVAACDLLVPRVGELIGGSQREERLSLLKDRMLKLQMEESAYARYLDTRRFGSVPHSGFGLGFERLLMYVTGIQNIRDVIPFPRTAGSIY
jgi:asparaginyl-tRNA synthetase